MTRMPTYFISHGGGPWPWMADWRAMFKNLEASFVQMVKDLPERPKAILMISGHWEDNSFAVMSSANPPMVYDYSGFPPHTFQIQYKAPGAPDLAQKAADLIKAAGLPVRLDEKQGFDHGCFVPAYIMYPDASVPVFQVSLPSRLDAERAWAFGRALAPLADDGVLIVGSGSLTHNLFEFRGTHARPEAYAAEFAGWVREAVTQGDRTRLMRTLDDAPHARRAHPTAEHFWPLLVAAGAADPGLPAQVIDGGITHGVLAMDAYAFGMAGERA